MSITLPAPNQPAAGSAWKPSALRLGLGRVLLEVKLFNRDVLSLVLVLFFPILMMSLFGTVFGDEPNFGTDPNGNGGITPAHYYLPGMLALSTILSGFQNLSSYVATERFNGTVKRLAGTPLPAASYFIGKTGQTLYLIVAQTVLLLLAAKFLFDVPLPTEAGQWLLISVLMILSTAAWATVAIAFTALPKSAQSASTLAVLPVLLLSFTSGVYFPFSQLPAWLQSVANLFPLRWTASALRSVFLPAGFEAVEPGGSYDLPLTFLVLAVWAVAGAILAKLVFTWPPQK
ncbi:ABC transporter permease [Arthrobacter sp. CDRTa11]|uniref:ABC transporter permease n=1 Tax=Arthrobacter sp. CDRTa11 TaxID=2651199 RepID=UPI0022658CBC|nr:ABC transporter permease [Arthrobacter sp. CDRTa11]UZX04173.1 ABC transporter permease [Arthrobacter sp. CDRTa11]